MRGRTTLLREEHIEDYIASQLPLHWNLLGVPLLLIGRQVHTGERLRVDLLAIDTAGTIYIIELKYTAARPAIIAQITQYQAAVARLTRDQLIEVASRRPLRLNLEAVFRRHFGHALPLNINSSQVLIICAQTIPKVTSDSIQSLRAHGYRIDVLQHTLHEEAVSFAPWRPSEVTRTISRRSSRRARRRHAAPKPRSGPWIRNRRSDLEDYWHAISVEFTSSLITFAAIYASYQVWHESHADKLTHPRPLQQGTFAQHLASLLEDEREWSRVFIPTGSRTALYGSLPGPIRMSSYRGDGCTAVAYVRSAAHSRSTSSSSPS